MWALSGPVTSSGTLTVNGGDAVKYAGGGGNILLYSSSDTVATTGSLAANGGDSATTAMGSNATAGNGGYVYLDSTTPPSAYGSISVVPGSGGDPDYSADIGYIVIDGSDVTPPDGTLP